MPFSLEAKLLFEGKPGIFSCISHLFYLIHPMAKLAVPFLPAGKTVMSLEGKTGYILHKSHLFHQIHLQAELTMPFSPAGKNGILKAKLLFEGKTGYLA